MATLYDVDAAEFINKAAQELKKTKAIEKPEWANYVKTGSGRDRIPEDADWWYFRAASMLRRIYMKGPIGVTALRRFYGNKKNRGVRPGRFTIASGKIIRTILQQLESEGLVVQAEKGVHKGRIITAKGRSFSDKLIKVKGEKVE